MQQQLDPNEIKQAIFRLAHFDPTCQDQYGNQVIDYLVLDSLAAFGQSPVNALQIRKRIKETFRLDFEESEINKSGKRLGQREGIKYKEGEQFQRPIFQILPQIEQKIANNLVQIQELENEVIEDWKEELFSKYKEYPVVKDNVNRIVSNLQFFTSRMFIRHGIQCVALLYPEKRKVKQWVESIESSIIEILPKIDPFIDAVIKLEIPNFFKKPDAKRKIYITSLFNSSFFWHLVQVDEKCSKLLQKVTKGQQLYLDNNILYSLVGLHGANMLQSVHSMLKLGRMLGYEFHVTTKSIDEFHESLKWQMKEINQKPPIPSELAKIAVKNLEKDSFLTSYWNEFVKNGISIEEFVVEKSHLEDILHGFDISKTSKYREDIEDSPELLNEKSILRSIAAPEISEHIIEHDAFHRVFIKKIRRVPKYHFYEAVAWFLTHDNKLPVYDKVARKGQSFLPFCITSDQWIQINRPLLTRTANQKEYEESFHVLVTQPFLRTMVPALSLDEIYNKVLGKLARYKNMNPELAVNIVTDRHFMFTMPSEDDEEQIKEKIDSKLVDIANQLQSKKKTLEKDVQGLEKKIGNVEKLLEENNRKYQEQIKALEKSFENEKKKRETVEKESENIEKKFKIFKISLRNWIIFFGVLGLTSLFLWLHQMWLNWNWLNTHKNKTIIEIAVQLLLVIALLNFPLKRHWKLWTTLIAMIIIGILTFASL